MSARDKQVGGSHYTDMAIQPIEFAMVNKLDACQTKIIKYVCRHEWKDGEKDLDKAAHMIELLREFKYGK